MTKDYDSHYLVLQKPILILAIGAMVASISCSEKPLPASAGSPSNTTENMKSDYAANELSIWTAEEIATRYAKKNYDLPRNAAFTSNVTPEFYYFTWSREMPKGIRGSEHLLTLKVDRSNGLASIEIGPGD